ncbi:hypothetical protein FBGL_01255 [Flavobacterium glycines]|uniref:Uncharacterized protein n=1 Tax=Flavobacterium glycines TaxID=551990 RepID=A0A1B9DY51_9FLAO|nr:hypothetical protein FBGL_01255 [Flavobacterium glycines]
MRKNAVNSNLIFIFIMFSLEFQATEQSNKPLAIILLGKNYAIEFKIIILIVSNDSIKYETHILA